MDFIFHLVSFYGFPTACEVIKLMVPKSCSKFIQINLHICQGRDEFEQYSKRSERVKLLLCQAPTLFEGKSFTNFRWHLPAG
jgi:hypothetical protein